MSTINRIDIGHLKVRCKECNLRELCFPHGMSDEELTDMDAVVEQPRSLHKNDFLYRGGDKAMAIYAVRSGCIKTMTESANGDEDFAAPERSGHSMAHRLKNPEHQDVARNAWEKNKNKHNEICDTLQPRVWGYKEADSDQHRKADDVIEMLQAAWSAEK